ncbi:beta strand repeat-containing protein [Acidithiobacillus sulfuriphilus]|uniref:Filamentous hemagglutinin N-terminal domain-containing protein n=3 Tax=Acidithiobacillus sulfuriphilus TaxID=1867749 RepID=A0ACD5HRP5_9PROT
MRTAKKPAFSRKPLFAAMIFALSAPVAFATPTPSGPFPGNGTAVYGTVTAAIAGSTATVTVGSGNTVITWGASGALLPGSSTGFNIGSSAAVVFQNNALGSAAVLNIDVTGTPSQIYGSLSATVSGSATADDAPTLYVANANGVVVGSGATISAPYGVGFIGADLNSTQAQAVFASCGAVPLNFDNTAGSVSVQNGVNWGATTSFLLVAGAGSVNVGSAPGGGVLFIDGGVGGHFSPIGAGIATSDQGSASSIASLSTSNYSSGFVYQDASTSVSVNLGTASTAPALEDVSAYADGTLDNSGVLNASGGTITLNASGTITNTSGISAAGMTINTTDIYGNSSTAQNGAFINTGSSAKITISNSVYNAYLTAAGTSFSNLSGASISVSASGSGNYAELYFDGNSAFTNSGSGSTININANSGDAYLTAYGTSFSNLSGASISISGDNATSYNSGLYFGGSGAFLNGTGATINISGAGGNDNSGYLTAYGTSFTNLGVLNFSGSGDELTVNASSGSINLSGAVTGAGLDDVDLMASSVGQSIFINTALNVSPNLYSPGDQIDASASNMIINAPVSAGTFVYYAHGSSTGTASTAPLVNNFTVTTLGSISAPTIDVAYHPNQTSGDPSTGYGNFHGSTTAGYQSLTNLDINGPLLAGTAGTVNFGQAVQGYNGNTYSSAIDVVSGSSFITAATIAFNNLLSPPHPVNQITFTPSGHYFPITTQPTSSVSQATNLPGNGEVIYTDPLSVVFNTSTIYQNPSQVPGLGTSSTGATINISGQTNVTPGTPSPLIIDWGVPASYSTLNPGTASGFDIGTGAVLSFVNDATYAGGTPAAVDVLNIDVSGYPSNLYGTLDYQGNGGSLWVANGNGILVGSSATLTAPGGLGLIAPGGIQNITAPNVYNLMTSFVTGTMGLDFNDTNATGGVVSIARGADLSGVQQFLDVAGYNSVNVDAPGLANTVALSVDGGIGAHVNTATGAMVPYDDSSVSGYLTDAPTNVRLDVGTGTSAGTAYSNAGALFLADGNLTNLGNLSVNETQVDWINGTFSNDGALQMTPVGNQGYAVLGFNTGTTAYIPSGLTPNTQTVYGNASSAAPTGDFVNAGVLNATTATEGFGFFGAGFQNDAGATLNVSGSAYIGTTNDGVTLAGSMSPLSGSLAVVALGANSVINVQSPISAATGVLLAANTVNISSVIDPLGSFTFFGPESGAAQMNLAAGGSIDAGDVYLGTEGSASITNFVLNGTINGSNSVLFGSGSTPTGHVKGAGSITTPSLTFANLQGSVHNIVSPVIALNGFQVNAENPASTSPALNTVNLSVSADGNGEQGVNLKVNGNLAIDSGNTQAIDAGGAAPANANSILYVQATGNVQVNAGTGANNYGSIAVPNTTDGLFQFPGLVYLQAGNGGGGDSPSDILMVGSPTNPVVIANAFSPSAQVGREGVFLIAPTINYWANSLYTNGNAGVVFAAPYDGLGFPSAAINGNAPTATSYVTDYMPTVYFMRSVPTAAYGEELLPSDVFTNDNGQLQEMQTFLNLY